MKTGPAAGVIVAHQRFIGSVAPFGPWIWTRSVAAVDFVKLMAKPLPVSVTPGGPICVAAAGLYAHCVAEPFGVSFKLKPMRETES